MHGRKNEENCALNLVDEIILYYDARSKKHQKRDNVLVTKWHVRVIIFLRKRNNIFPFYCCQPRCFQCCNLSTTMGSLCTVVLLKHILYCCQQLAINVFSYSRTRSNIVVRFEPNLWSLDRFP